MKRAAATFAFACALVGAGASARAAIMFTKTVSTANPAAGGTITYHIHFSRNLSEANIVIDDPLPAGHAALLSIAGSGGGTTVACPGAGAILPNVNATCDAAGHATIALPINSTPNQFDADLTYQLAPTVTGSVSNTATLTCSAAACPITQTATATLCTPALTLTKTANPNTVGPGGAVTYTVTATNSAACAAPSFTITDTLPAGITPGTVTAPNATPMTSGQTVTVAPTVPLAATGAYSFTIAATVGANTPLGTLTNTATVTWPGGTASGSADVTVAANPLVLSKTVSPASARVGDTVTYTLSAVPGGATQGQFTLTDTFDAALRIGQVTVNGQPATCGPGVTPIGAFTLTCGADGRSFELDGAQLNMPLNVRVAATVLPAAGASVPNTAFFTDVATSKVTTASATLTIQGGATNASLLLTAGKVLASKADLVPFVANIGVPSAAPALASPVLVFSPTPGLRIGDVRLVDPAGMVTFAKPIEAAGALVVPLPALAPGSAMSVTARARVTSRAGVGGRETVHATLLQSAPSTVIPTGVPLAGAAAVVRIVAEPEFDLATILGEVYRDENENGVRDPGERGIEGAIVVMDDGLQAVTDGDGRYHLAAVVPGERAIKVARHTLPPGSRITTDETRVLMVTPAIVLKIDYGIKVPLPEPPAARPQPPSTVLPELRPGEAGGLVYRLTGMAAPGAHVSANGKAARVEKNGAWAVDVILARGRTRLPIVTEFGDGRVVVSSRDVFWVDRGAGGSLIVPRREEPRLTLRFPAGALAEPSFLLEGVATAPMTGLTVAGQKLQPDAAGHVAIKLRVPEAGAGIPIEAAFSDGLRARFDHALAAGGDYVMLVGLVEGKFGYVVRDGAASGSPSTYIAEGRVKLYAKGRIQGRWLLEGAINLDSTQISSWRDLFRGDPQQMFRNLDPDRFYTVYGDSSATTQPANSRARLFVRIQFDRSELLFGNLQTGLTGVEMGRYSRAVTGGRLSFVRAGSDDPDAPPSTQIILFGACLQTQRAHDELLGTGGSLFYLSHRYIVEGSEQVRVEIRDRISDRPLANTPQRATVDYEVDYFAGRVHLRDPLSTIGIAPSLVRSSNLEGDHAFLIVDYEYVVDGDIDDGTAGARATQKIGPVRLGGTFVNEFRAGGNYTLVGGDVQVDLKKYGVIIGEYAHSYGSLSSFARSDDGGLTFADAQGVQAQQRLRDGAAWKAEADLHFKGVTLRPYVRAIDHGYTDTSHAQDAGFLQFGGELEASVWKFRVRAHYDERRWSQLQYDAAGAPILDANNNQVALNETRRDAGGEIGMQFKRFGFRVGARTERADDADPTRAGHRTAVAARFDVQVAPKLTLYATGQYAVEHGGGTGLYAQDNSLGALGAIAQLPWETKLTAEASYGAMGAGGLLSLRSERGPGRVLYGTVTFSQDRDDRLMSTVAAGGRERIVDARGNARAILFAEDQFRDGPVALGGRAHVLATGVEVPIAKRFMFGATFERGTVAPSGTPFSPGAQQPLERTAGTLSASYGGERLRVQARGELRNDSIASAAGGGATTPELQWIASGMLTWKAHKDFTVRGKVLWSTSSSNASILARSTEATAGFAWRPSFTDRFALLGRYTYLDEGIPAAQGASGPVDPVTGQALSVREQSHVMSLGGEGRVVWRFSLGEKVAAKWRTEPTVGTSGWFILWVNRLSFHVTRRLDAVAEYRLLTVPGTSLQHGAAVEANVILIGHLRLGAGWNFADFSDNELTLGRGRENGFYVRAEGFY
jgi:uncharacterized repeat protein (TIGR01451 family)/fimbrial isopeptide formation D2 family protein